MVAMNRRIRHSCSQKDPFDNSSLLNKFALIPVLFESNPLSRCFRIYLWSVNSFYGLFCSEEGGGGGDVRVSYQPFGFR